MKNKYIAKRHWNTVMAPLSKTNEMAVRYDDVIDLSIGDPDYPADSKCLELMYNDALTGHTHYTAFLGDDDLRKETIKTYKEDYDYDFNMDEILITNGGTHALYLTMEAILDEGDEVIAVAPYYLYYKPQIEMPRGKLIVYNTKSVDNFDINIDELEKHVTHRTKAVVINSPNNPSGKVYSKENLEALYKLAEKHDFLIIADDIYGALNYTSNKFGICTLEKSPNRIITVYSYSKDYSMTGLRLGHVIAHSDLIDTMRSINEAVSFTVNSMAQRCGIYLQRDRKRIQASIRDEYQKRVMYIYDRVNKINNISSNYPQGSFYLFVNIENTGISDMDIWEKILDEAHVLVLPGSAFGKAGNGYIRIACTVGIEVLEEAFNRIERMDIFK